MALGSDSAVTAKGDLLDELRQASQYVSPARLYRMVTEEAARILRLPPGFGSIVPGGPADLIAIADSRRSPAEALLHAKRPELVLVAGKVKLTTLPNARLQRLKVEGRGEFFVDADVPRLRRQVPHKSIRLAGKRVLP